MILFVKLGGEHPGFLVPSFIFNVFCYPTVTEAKLIQGNKAFNLMYAIGTAFPDVTAQAVQCALDRLEIRESKQGMYFSPSNYEIFFQACPDSVCILILSDDQSVVKKSLSPTGV